MRKFCILTAAMFLLISIGFAQDARKAKDLSTEQIAKEALIKEAEIKAMEIKEAEINEAELKEAEIKEAYLKEVALKEAETKKAEKPESVQMMRQNPNPVTVNKTDNTPYLPFKGDDTDLLYSTATTSTDKGVYKTTVGNPGGTTPAIATITRSYQAMEKVGDEIWVTTYQEGPPEVIQFGKLNPETGVLTVLIASGAPDVISMAHNPITDEVYCVVWGTNTSSPFGKISSTGVFTSLGNVPGIFYITIDNDGVCYAVGNGGSGTRFGTVNLANGAFTQISTWTNASNYIQDLTVDRETNEIYHAARWTDMTGGIPWRKFNKITGERILIGTFPTSRIPESLVIMGFVPDPDAPAAVNNLTVTPGASGALSAAITWTNPSLTYNGGALTSITAVKVYQNGELVHTVPNPAPGSAGSHNVTVTVAGNYTYKVIAENAAGEGPDAKSTVWIGPDVPAAPSNATLVNNAMVAEVSWTAPTTGLNGGYFSATGLVYDLFRMPGNVSVATNHTTTTFTETITQPGSISYRIVAKNGGGNGGEATTNLVSFCPIISTFPYEQGFEEGAFPVCWEQEYVNATTNWTVVTASTGTPATVTGGAYKARFYSTVRGVITRLVTPPIDLTGITDPILKFWHTQRLWVNDQDELRILYKTSASGSWTQLAVYTNNVTDWTERTIALPNPTADYYIAFEGKANYGYGVQLDDILIYPAPVDPVIRVPSQPVAMGNVYNNLPYPSAPVTRAVENIGGGTLTVTGFDNTTNPELLVTGLPVSVSASATENITFLIDANGLPAGAYTGQVVLNSNCILNPAYPVNVTANVVQAHIAMPLEEDWEGTSQTGWVYQNMSRAVATSTPPGNPGAYLRGNLYGTSGSYWLSVAQTPYTMMGANPVISYDFRAFGYSSPYNPAPPLNFRYQIIITKDNFVTQEILRETQFGDYNSVASWENVYIPTSDLTEYINEICIVQVRFIYNPPPAGPGTDIWVAVDNFYMGTPPVDELEAVSLAGNSTPTVGAPANYTVTLTNKGSNSQTSSDYSVKLMQEGNITLQTVPGVEITAGETKQIVITHTFTQAGLAKIWGVIDFPNDENPYNNTTNTLDIDVQPEGTTIVTIGTGTANYRAPIDVFYRRSLSQSLYLNSEIGYDGAMITMLKYKINRTTNSTNVSAVPITIWMGETDLESFSGNSWINPSNLTQVYHGVHDLSQQGQYDVTFELDDPYIYSGGTLVVYMQRHDTGYASSSDGFFGTGSSSIRTIRAYSDSAVLDPVNPGTTGTFESITGYPNLTMALSSELGALTGIVTSNGSPVEGVKIQVVGQSFFRITDATGAYNFAHLPAGNYNIEVSKHGYITQIIPVTVTTGETTTQNVSFVEYEKVVVSGIVSGNDNVPGIEGVAITLAGYDNYTTTTNEDGFYSITGVYADNIYQIVAQKQGYNIYSAEIEVETVSLIYNIELVETIYTPFGLDIEVDNDNCTALFTWNNNLQENIFDGFESYPNYSISNPLGPWRNINLNTSITWTHNGVNIPDNSAPKAFMVYDTNVQPHANFHHRPGGTGSKFLLCFAKQSGQNDDWLISEALDFRQPFVIKFWARSLAYHEQEGYGIESFRVLYSTTGNNPSDFTNLVGGNPTVPLTWAEYSYAIPPSANHVAIHCNSYDEWALVVDDVFIGIPEKDFNSKSLLGYTVYLNGVEKATGLQEPEFTFTNLGPGNYIAGVKADYSSGSSEIVEIPFTTTGVCVTYSVTFEVTDTYTNEPVTDATIVLRGQTQTSYVFDEVPPGNHPFTVSKDDYITASGNVIVVDQDVTWNVDINPVLYTLNFVVFKEGTTIVITDATIVFNGTLLTGYTVDAPKGTYNFVVSKEGYYDYEGTLTIIDDMLQMVYLTPVVPSFTVTFIVIDESGGEINDATIKWNGAVVGYVIENVVEGNYNWEVSHPNYFTKSDTKFVDEDVEIEVELVWNSIRTDNISNVVLYPNPFTNEINISYPELIKSVQITNATGQAVKHSIFDGKAINTENISSGVYFVTVESLTGDKAVYKMVKK